MSIFTFDELSSLNKRSLVRLAKYYKIDTSGLSKEKLMEKLTKILIKDEQIKEEERPMSVQVRRAMESIKNG